MKLVEFYKTYPIEVVRGRGSRVWDSAGTEYLDVHTGYGAAFLGHCHPHIVSALKQQLERIMVVPLSFDCDVRRRLLEKLRLVLPQSFTHVFMQNSGTEAVELALKTAVKVTGRRVFVALKHAFHGRTLGSLSVTYEPLYRRPYGPLLFEPRWVEPNDIDGLLKAVDENVAAVILEPVLGEGGVIPLSREFIKAAREAVDKVGALLIMDEVQTGFGRVGARWAFEKLGVEPDILVAGKAIGGGFPVSMVAFRKGIAEAFTYGEHGTTYGGNPLACAAVSAAIDVLLEENVPRQAAEKGAKLRKILEENLAGVKMVREVRGEGLMIGVDLEGCKVEDVLKCLLYKHHIIALRAGKNVLRLLPPYLVSSEEMQHLVEAVKQCIEACRCTA